MPAEPASTTSSSSSSSSSSCPHSELIAQRAQHSPSNLRLSYATPLHIVRGAGQYLYDCAGTEYLDFYNNVAHVGHCHPHVTQALIQQAQRLNTNTRYLSELHHNYTKKLLSALPPELSVVYVVNSGSEANDLALRIARAYTGRAEAGNQGERLTPATEVLVLEAGYHGISQQCIDISPYKWASVPGYQPPSFVHVCDAPDTFRGKYRGALTAGQQYAADVQQTIDQLGEQPHKRVLALIHEGLLSCAGQIVLPDGYIERVYRSVRAVGGVCIADEVQTAFGRTGTFCAFQHSKSSDSIPDIVTFGKSTGNGYPIGVVVARRHIAEPFNGTGMEFFSSTGGSDLSSAVGLAVLEVIEQDNVAELCAKRGHQLMTKLQQLRLRYSALIGDVRGKGLMIGIELIEPISSDPIAPSAAAADFVVQRLKTQHHILTGTDGVHHNIIKLKGPVPLTEEDVDRFMTALEECVVAYQTSAR